MIVTQTQWVSHSLSVSVGTWQLVTLGLGVSQSEPLSLSVSVGTWSFDGDTSLLGVWVTHCSVTESSVSPWWLNNLFGGVTVSVADCVTLTDTDWKSLSVNESISHTHSGVRLRATRVVTWARLDSQRMTLPFIRCDRGVRYEIPQMYRRKWMIQQISILFKLKINHWNRS